MKKEEIELAEQHISLSEDIINEQAKDADSKDLKKLQDAELALEKAEADLQEIENQAD